MGAISSPVRREFTSPQQPITTGGSLTLAHSLGVSPVVVSAVIVCVTAENGYAIGDRLPVALHGADNGASGSVPVSVAVEAGEVNLFIRFCNFASVFRGLSKSTGALATFSNANWNLVLRALA